MAAPILHHGNRKWNKIGNGRKDRLEGYAPFCFNFFFLQTIFAQLTPLFYLYLHLKPILRSVSFSDTGSLDRDIIFRDRTYRVFCFLGWVVKFRAREANSRWRSASSNPDLAIEFVFFFTFFLFFFSFLLFPSYFQYFFWRSNAHTYTNKGGGGKGMRRDEEGPKGDREQFTSLDLWITD